MHIVGHKPAVTVAGVGWAGFFVLLLFFYRVYPIFPFLMPHLLGDDSSLERRLDTTEILLSRP